MKLSQILPILFRPEVYQGKNRHRSYFEGWYFKFVSDDGGAIWSVIPGVSHSTDSHSFVQVVDARGGSSHYIRYPLEAFGYSRKELLIEVGGNRFTGERVVLDLNSGELELKGSLWLEGLHPFPVSLASPGIMGWYGYVPFMECYHGVVSMWHGLTGHLQVNGSEISFNGGKGYIEKDWGKSMPSDWIWIQSNHFGEQRHASFMISLARIPWLGGFFPGFLGFLMDRGKLYRFATYNRSRVDHIEVTGEEVRISVRNNRYRLDIVASLDEGVVLKAPRQGAMERDIRESMIASVQVRLTDGHGALIFSDTGIHAGVEIVGNVEHYFRNYR